YSDTAWSSSTTINITVSPDGENYSSGWSSFKDLTLNTGATGGANVTSRQDKFPVLIRLTSKHLAVFQQAKSDGSDLRFANAGGTHLPFQLERWSFQTGDTSAAIWVLVDSVRASNTTTVRMYWGNASAANRSSGPAVFDTLNAYSGVWHLGESASPSSDATILGSSAQWLNAPASTTGFIGKAINLSNGASTGLSGQYLAASYNPANANFKTSSANGVTISAWVNRAGASATTTTIEGVAGRYNAASNHRIFGLGDSISTCAWNAQYSTDGTTNGALLNSGVATPVATGTWVHVTATLKNGAQAIYVNGVSKATGSTGSLPALDSAWADAAFTIGKRDSSEATKNEYFNGIVDEVEFSKTVRSADWIKLGYLNQKNSTAPLYDLSYGGATLNDTLSVSATHTPTVTGAVSLYSLTGTLPTGLSFNTATGVISGIPLATGTSNLTVTAYSDSSWSTSTTFNLVVNAYPFSLRYAPVPTLEVGRAMLTDTPVVSGITPTSYSISPALPAGLAFDTLTGRISGTPTVSASSTTYTLTAKNSGTPLATATVSFAVQTAENYAVGWANSTSLTLNTNNIVGTNVTTAQVGFPVLIRLTSAHRAVFQQSLVAGGGDLRFSRNGKNLPYQIERWSAISSDTSAAIWVSVDTVAANGTTTINMYWGNGSVTSRSNGPAVFDYGKGFVGDWHLGEATGDTAHDATGFNFHGTPGTTFGGGGNPFDTLGVVGQAKSFRMSGGTSGAYYVMDGTAPGSTNTTPSSSPLHFAASGPYTISAWTRFTMANTTGMIVTKGDVHYQLARRNSGAEWSFHHNPTTSSTTALGRTITSAVTGTWVHLTGVRTGPDSTLASARIYLNGTLAGTNASTAVAAQGTSAYPLTFGRDPSSTATRYYGGSIDEVQMSNVARPADWVKQTYLSQKIGVIPLFGNAAFATSSPTYNVGANITPNTLTVTGTVTRCVVSPALPAGLALSASTCTISGTPTTTSPSTNYTVTALNDSAWSTTATINITVAGSPLSLSYPTPPTYEVGAAIVPINPTVTSHSATTYSISPNITTNTGLSFNTSTGVISGTPTIASAAVPYTVTATTTGFGFTTATITVSVLAGETYSASWPDSATLTLNTGSLAAGVTTAQTNFPVLVRLNSSHRTVFQQAKSDGSDIRFAAANGSHLRYQIERWSTASTDTSAAIWVKADTVTANGLTTLKMYWGNPSASSRSNGQAVFDAANNFHSVWHLGDATGITPRPNAVAGGNSALPTNFPTNYTPRTGLIGLADTLRGGAAGSSSDYLDLGSGYKKFTSGLTYSMWAYPTYAPNFARLFEVGNATNANDNISLFRS
ncbi:MAG TPA: hypothetical protein DCQ83_07430, partial [Fibrobacteres bacterium]|nr:hypothetical protein [Fibrobacterota bacterium]